MDALRRVGLWLRTHKRGDEEALAVVDVGWLVTRLLPAFGVGAGVASAAVLALAPGQIDLSNNNGARAAVAIAAPGVRAVEAKATEGLAFRDPDYPVFRAKAHAVHRAFGGYMFLHPDLSGAAQADYFLAYAHPRPGDIQPVVDSEVGSPSAAAPATYAALHELERRGYRPILYASSWYLGQLVKTVPALKQFRVWEAEYGPRLELIPGVKVVAWQFTETARVAGFDVDGSHLLVKRLALIEYKPPKPLTPAEKKIAALHTRTGFYAWLAWYLHEGAWKPYAIRAAIVRPHVPVPVPRSYWPRERAFVKARARG